MTVRTRWLGVVLGLLVVGGCAPRRPPAAETPAQKGERLFTELGCRSCHTTDGSPGACPTLAGVYRSEVRLVDGTTLEADDAYLRESILNPDAKIVQGYTKGVMSAAVSRAQIEKDGNLDALVAYLKTLKGKHEEH